MRASGMQVMAGWSHTSTIPDAIYCVAFSPDDRVVCIGGGHTARLWDVETGAPVGEPLLHDDNVRDVAL